MRIIELVDYCESWSASYKQEVGLLQKIIKNNFVQSFHIGSTAITGMKSKSTIDILIEVSSLSDLDNEQEEFGKLGYISKGEYGINGRRLFYKGTYKRSHHVHTYESGSEEIENRKAPIVCRISKLPP